MRVENDEMYGDWSHWLEARCPGCQETLRAHHLHDFASFVCPKCRANPLLHYCGVTNARKHVAMLTRILLDEEILPQIAADVAGELKADATLPQFVDFLISMHYVTTDGLEKLIRKRIPRDWIEAIVMTYNPQVPANAASQIPHHGDRVNLEDYEIGPELAKRVPRTVARVYRCVPVWADGARLVLAVDDPDKVRPGDVGGLLGCEVVLVKATRAQITDALKRHYGSAGWQEALW